jgi:hypothetical protein
LIFRSSPSFEPHTPYNNSGSEVHARADKEREPKSEPSDLDAQCPGASHERNTNQGPHRLEKAHDAVDSTGVLFVQNLKCCMREKREVEDADSPAE